MARPRFTRPRTVSLLPERWRPTEAVASAAPVGATAFGPWLWFQNRPLARHQSTVASYESSSHCMPRVSPSGVSPQSSQSCTWPS